MVQWTSVHPQIATYYSKPFKSNNIERSVGGYSALTNPITLTGSHHFISVGARLKKRKRSVEYAYVSIVISLLKCFINSFFIKFSVVHCTLFSLKQFYTGSSVPFNLETIFIALCILQFQYMSFSPPLLFTHCSMVVPNSM